MASLAHLPVPTHQAVKLKTAVISPMAEGLADKNGTKCEVMHEGGKTFLTLHYNHGF